MRTLLAALVLAPAANACSFCAANADKPTLREVVGRSGIILIGTATTATIDPDGGNPATPFTPLAAIKGVAQGVTLRRYLPSPDDNPQRLIVFAKSADRLADPELIVNATPALEKVVRELTQSPPASKLAFAFAHLSDADEAVRADSFAEFARASDDEVAAAKAGYDPAKLRTLLAGADARHAGVFAVLLGHCARPEDAAFLDLSLATAGPALGGTLAGLALADAKLGWKRIAEVVGDPKRNYSERFASLNAARFVRRCRPADYAEAAKLALTLLNSPDFADAAAEDLRAWKCWDATPKVIAAARLPANRSRLARRAFVRFALASPDPRARAFVEEVRVTDPELVADLRAADSP